jgi:hypothetical protein
MRLSSLLIMGLTAVALAGPACDSGGDTISGLDSGLIVGELSEVDLLSGCEKLTAYKAERTASISEEFHHSACLLQAIGQLDLTSGEIEDACLAKYNICKWDTSFDPAALTCSFDPTCLATVGAVEACEKELLATFIQITGIVGSHDCSSVLEFMTEVLEMGQEAFALPACRQDLLGLGCDL